MTHVPMAITYLGSDIWSYKRRTAGAIFVVTVPDTIMTSACRGDGRNTSAPKRAISKRAVPTAIISMAQQANPKVIGHKEEVRAQAMSESNDVTMAWPLRSHGTSSRDSRIWSAGWGWAKSNVV